MLYLTAASTGLRAGECALLTKSSFDFEAMTWTIHAASAKMKNHNVTVIAIVGGSFAGVVRNIETRRSVGGGMGSERGKRESL